MILPEFIGKILIAPNRRNKTIRHTTCTVELGRKIKLPCLERSLITGRNNALELILQWLIAKLILVSLGIEGSLLDIRITKGCRHSPSAENLHGRFYLPVV